MKTNQYNYINPALQNLEKYLQRKKSVLRKLQKPLFKDIVSFVRNYKNNNGKGYVVAPMGSGKTVIFTELVKAVGQRAIIAVPTIQLLDQTQKEFAVFAPHIRTGLLYNKKKQLDADVVITTHASLVINIKSGKLKPSDFDWLILDEVHEMLSAERMKAVKAFNHAITIGFTGSDKYNDEKEVAKLLPTEIHRITIPEAVEGGLICPFSVTIAETTTSLAKVRSIAGDYSKRDLEKAVNIEARNRAAVALYESTPFFKGKSLMCHCVSTAHADAVAKKFRRNGWKAAAVHYKIPTDKQKGLIEQFLSGELTVLCDVNQLIRGFNAPILAICFNLDPTRSVVKATQRARNLRIDINKPDKFAVIVDFLDKDFNKKTPPITFDQVINRRALVIPSSWRGTRKLRTIEKRLIPIIKLTGLNVHTKSKEVLRITKAILKRQKEVWFSEDEVRSFFIKKKMHTMADYDKNREARCPASVDFPRIYGKTFGEVVHGKHGKIFSWPTEKAIKAFFFKQKYSGSNDYNANHPDGYPNSRTFNKIYGKTFGEVMYGKRPERNIKWPSKSKIISFFKKHKFKDSKAYNTNRPKGYPTSGMFPKIYHKTFREIAPTGKKWLSVNKIKKIFTEKKFTGTKDYDKNRSESCPHSGSFSRIYGKTFMEIIYGRKLEQWPTEKVLRSFLKKNHIKNQQEYNHKRSKGGLPKADFFLKIYGKTFGEILHGKKGVRKKVNNYNK